MAKQTINLEPQVLDLVLYAGDGASFSLLVTDDLGDPIDLVGTMKAQIRNDRGTGTARATFVVDLTQAAEGIALLSLTGTSTQALAPATEKFSGVWDLEWTATGKQPLTLCQGNVECLPDVSN